MDTVPSSSDSDPDERKPLFINAPGSVAQAKNEKTGGAK